MQYSFFIFFSAIAIGIYYLVPAKIRLYILLFENFLFYYLVTDRYSFWIVPVVCLLSWVGGKAVSRFRNRGTLGAFLLLDLAILIYGRLHVSLFQHLLSTLGLSFFVLEGISYVIDVYRNKIQSGSLVITAVYVSFFPTIVSGPIERADHLFSQFNRISTIHKKEICSLQHFYESFILILYSVFLKFVMADRLGIVVDYVFTEHWHLGSTGLIIGALAYGFQLYCDFSGYSFLALGIANAMGIRIIDNFHAPYLCTDIHQFWSRWHISLSQWLRDYVYIPLGGNRNGRIRKYLNLMTTFIVSGLWHGTGVTFILWGALHGIYQILADLLYGRGKKSSKDKGLDLKGANGVKEKRKKRAPLGKRFLLVLFTFFLVDFAWILFRSQDMETAADFYQGIFTRPDWYQLFNGTIFNYGLKPVEVVILIPAFLLLLLVDLLTARENVKLDQWLIGQPIVFQVLFLVFLFTYSLIFGVYGPGYTSGQFIYAQF